MGRHRRALPTGPIDFNYNSAVQLHRGNLYLIGLPGAGKTTLGRQLARRLGKPFLDADRELERTLGVSIPTIFEIEGEVSFRNREEAMLAELVQRTNVVLATGGGVVLRPANREYLKENGTVVYLHADPAVVYQRVQSSRNRPLLNTPDRLAKLYELYGIRDVLYREVADVTVESERGEIARFAASLEAAQAGSAEP